MNLEVIILAAGQGTRMRSDLPKVLHPLAGKSLLAHVIDTAVTLEAKAIHAVYGHGGETVPQALADAPVSWILQADQLGTGHAVAQAMPNVEDDSVVLILYGDVPLISAQTLKDLLDIGASNKLGLLTARLNSPQGYGRIIRDPAGHVMRIVEQKDADNNELLINEINTGMLAVNAGFLRSWLKNLKNENSQGEFYLTDIVAMAVADSVQVEAVVTVDEAQILGVNTKAQLAQLERVFQQRQADRLLENGVTLLDPARFDLRGELEFGSDVAIDVNVVIEGLVKLGDGVRIGPNVVLKNVTIGDGCNIDAFSHLEDAILGANCQIGPYARLRPGSELADSVKVGNFVEIKKTQISDGSKVNHLSYIGDAKLGKNVNIGAGTITCNYDGANKHQTNLGDNTFVGSNTALVAPVNIGDGATIGAGSTISKDVEADQLALTRAPQKRINNWPRPVKKKV